MLYVLSESQAKGRDQITRAFHVRKVFSSLVNAQAHLRYLQTRYTTNGWKVLTFGKVGQVVGGISCSIDYGDERDECLCYELTEIQVAE